MTLEPSAKVAPPPVMPKLGLARRVMAGRRGRTHVEVAVAVGDVQPVGLAAAPLTVTWRRVPKALAAAAAGRTCRRSP